LSLRWLCSPVLDVVEASVCASRHAVSIGASGTQGTRRNHHRHYSTHWRHTLQRTLNRQQSEESTATRDITAADSTRSLTRNGQDEPHSTSAAAMTFDYSTHSSFPSRLSTSTMHPSSRQLIHHLQTPPERFTSVLWLRLFRVSSSFHTLFVHPPCIDVDHKSYIAIGRQQSSLNKLSLVRMRWNAAHAHKHRRGRMDVAHLRVE
jgi:hypothetical protein